MELSLVFLLSSTAFLFISFFLFLPLFQFYRHKWVGGKRMPSLPPGDMGLPFIGESLEFLSAGWKGRPEKFVRERMVKFSSKVFKTSILFEPTAVLCGAAGNKFLFSNENKLVAAWWPRSVDRIFPSTLLTSSSEESRKMRKLIVGFLKPEALRCYVGIIDEVAARHFAAYWDGEAAAETTTVFPLAKRYTFAVACRLFLSMEDEGQVERFAEPFNDVAAGIISLPVDIPGTAFNRGIKAAGKIRRVLREIIKKRKAELAAAAAKEKEVGVPPQDILSHMVMTADEEGRCMAETEVADKILGLLIGGHDTASAAITFVVKYLAELPHVYTLVFNGKFFIFRVFLISLINAPHP